MLLNELRRPAIQQCSESIAKRFGKEGWPADRFLATRAEDEIAERDRGRLARRLSKAAARQNAREL